MPHNGICQAKFHLSLKNKCEMYIAFKLDNEKKAAKASNEVHGLGLYMPVCVITAQETFLSSPAQIGAAGAFNRASCNDPQNSWNAECSQIRCNQPFGRARVASFLGPQPPHISVTLFLRKLPWRLAWIWQRTRVWS